MSYRILVVDSDPSASAVAEQALVAIGHRVAPVSTFEEAIRQVTLDCPDLLVAALRLGPYNGLHVLMRARADYPDIPVVITGATSDFTPDIPRFSARFLSTPVDRAALTRLVSELLAGRVPNEPANDRRWPRKRTALPATVYETSARVVELSYEGVRLELPGPIGAATTPFDISFPTLGMSVTAVPRWSKSVAGGVWYGAEVALADIDATRQWRLMVDSLI